MPGLETVAVYGVVLIMWAGSVVGAYKVGIKLGDKRSELRRWEQLGESRSEFDADMAAPDRPNLTEL